MGTAATTNESKTEAPKELKRKNSASGKASKTSGKSKSKAKAKSMRELGSSKHSTATVPKKSSSLPRRQNSVSGRASRSSSRPSSARDLGTNSRHSAAPIMVSAGSGEIKKAPKGTRPSLARSGGLQAPERKLSSERHADARIDGLLQKLRDPSSRKLDMGGDMQASTAQDETTTDASAFKRPSMMGRFSKKL
ncbi:MAG: hypothetical protein SGARI_005805, partial [Bacillariaceae sp.]